jgi:hypothetical protein
MCSVLEIRAELNLADFVQDHVLLEDFALDDFRGLCGELLLAAGDQALPFPEKDPHGNARVEEHLDGDPVGQPADARGDERSEDE